MNIQEVKSLDVLERFCYWIREREAIRLKKEAGESRPWTTDEILQSYRFCNVRRMDDKVSRWLLNEWYTPYYGHPEMLRAVALARFVNLPWSLDQVGFPKRWDRNRIKKRLRAARANSHAIFNGAYMVSMIGGAVGPCKITAVVDHYCSPLRKKMVNSDSMEETHKRLHESYGIGSFMAGQIVADLRWATPGKWEDRNIWAPIGPGSKRGMNRLQERPPKQPLSQSQFEEELEAIIGDVDLPVPVEIGVRLEAHDWQNCLCEFDKYERCLWDEGRPKQKYPGVK